MNLKGELIKGFDLMLDARGSWNSFERVAWSTSPEAQQDGAVHNQPAKDDRITWAMLMKLHTVPTKPQLMMIESPPQLIKCHQHIIPLRGSQ